MRSLLALVVVGLLSGLASASPAQDKKKIVFVAGGPSHGYGDHEHLGGCMLLARLLNESGLPVDCVPAGHAAGNVTHEPSEHPDAPGPKPPVAGADA
jgi:hypothetical protein